MSTTRKTASAQAQRDSRLWELRKRRAGLVAKMYIKMGDPDRLLSLAKEALSLDRQIAALAAEAEATA